MRDCHGSRGRYFWEGWQPNIYCSTTTTTAYQQIRQLTLSNKWAAWWLIVISPQKLEALIKYFQIHPELSIFLKRSACFAKTAKKPAKSLKNLQQECVVIMGTAGDIDEDLLLESGDGSPEKAGNDDISHLGKRKNHRVKSAFKRGKMLVPREGPLTYFAFGKVNKKGWILRDFQIGTLYWNSFFWEGYVGEQNRTAVMKCFFVGLWNMFVFLTFFQWKTSSENLKKIETKKSFGMFLGFFLGLLKFPGGWWLVEFSWFGW